MDVDDVHLLAPCTGKNLIQLAFVCCGKRGQVIEIFDSIFFECGCEPVAVARVDTIEPLADHSR